MPKTLPPELKKAMEAQLALLSMSQEVAPIYASPALVFLLIGQLQLALRHPQNTGIGADAARMFIQGVRQQLAAPGSPLDQIIDLGFDPDFDLTVNEPVPGTPPTHFH